ncbi:MAG: ATP-dependent helicase [Candidatus Sericytochromatia bacterium]|nr:MAG: ATP-dependent helicase [Candidatus Sericytochromatia bacterium]GIX42028.1 MAG: ATP-dependent helicase [Leptospiraceae bacterium]
MNEIKTYRYNEKIIDNEKIQLIEVIKKALKIAKEAKFAIGYFFLDGFNLIKEDFPDNIKNKPFLKIIMGNETTLPTKEELASGYKLREQLKFILTENLENSEFSNENEDEDEQIKRIKDLKELIANNIIDVRLYEKSKMHAKLYVFITKEEKENSPESPGIAIVGSSNFTNKGLTINKELNVSLTSKEDVLYLEEWFNNLWEESIEFKEDFLKVIEFSGIIEKEYPKIGKYLEPETLFKYLVYVWFDGRIFNLSQKNILLEFQMIAVVNAIKSIDYYNGLILADSVGLGKSFIASAIIEEFLNSKLPQWKYKNKKPAVLLILPPSLISQWEELLISGNYFLKEHKNKTINNENYNIYEIYKGEELIGKIGFLSLGKFQNMKEQELNELAQNYELFIIDEAHKYRNKNTNRWKNIRKLQKKEDGFSNKFILLTATPLNNSVEDIINLINLFMDDTFAPFTHNNIFVKELISDYKKLKDQLYDINGKEKEDIKNKILEKSKEIKEKILDEIMILRTRKYIKEVFKDIKVNGKPIIFTDPKPYMLDYSLLEDDSSFSDKKDFIKKYKELFKTIQDNLEKIQFEHTKLYGVRFIVFQEESLDNKEDKKRNDESNKIYIEIAELFRLILSKRLESSLYAFHLTLKRIYEKEKIFYDIFNTKIDTITEEELKNEIINSVQKAKIDKDLEDIEEEYTLEEEQETWFDKTIKILLDYAEDFKEKNQNFEKMELLRSGLKTLVNRIKKDLDIMDKIFNDLEILIEKEIGKVPKQKDDIIELPIYHYKIDLKFESLKQILGNPRSKSQKLDEVPSLNNKKIIIFTQYKDTAYYVYFNLKNWIEKENDPTLNKWLKDTAKGIKMALITGDTETHTKIHYIKRFAPVSNDGKEEVEKNGEIEILISTDTISEGVNLQDADAVINFDLPWNPMILVQRVGRVNRIGNNKEIIVINYIPSEEIEILVGILRKLKNKIKDITLLIGKDSKILTQEEEINIQTFGEKIKHISSKSISELEDYGISEDFKNFLSKGLAQKQIIDEYKLIRIIDEELKYKEKDFKEIEKLLDQKPPFYTYIEGDDKLVSIYEIKRGQAKKKIIKSISDKDKKVKDETPMVFYELIQKYKTKQKKFENTKENLKEIKKEIDKILEEEKTKSLTIEKETFLIKLYNNLYLNYKDKKEKGLLKENEIIFNEVFNTLKYIANQETYSRKIKSLLIEKELIEDSEKIKIKDFQETIKTLKQFIEDNNLTSTKSLKPEITHIGWFYAIK